MTFHDMQILQNEIRDIVAQILEVDKEKLKMETKFVEDLGMDSMMALEILASIEKKYKVRIPEEYLSRVSSLSNIMEIVKEFIGK